MVKVAVHEPVGALADFAQELAGRAHELAALTLRLVQPAPHLGSDGTKRRRRRLPEPRREFHRDGRGFVVRQARDVRSRNRPLLEQDTTISTQQTNRTVTAPALQGVALVKGLVVALPRRFDDAGVIRGSDLRHVRHREWLAQLEPPPGRALLGRSAGVGEVHYWFEAGTHRAGLCAPPSNGGGIV